jgi:hypothetical protein
MLRICRVLSASWVALSFGWATAAVAGPTEDFFNAAIRGPAASIQALLDQGVDINARDINGCTALILASGNGRLDVVQALLAKGPDINAKCGERTALIVAAWFGHREVVRVLLDKGADVNAKDHNGTALDAARIRSHADIIALLQPSPAPAPKPVPPLMTLALAAWAALMLIFFAVISFSGKLKKDHFVFVPVGTFLILIIVGSFLLIHVGDVLAPSGWHTVVRW